jgi:Fur family transcriptional regulator, ferric uptake regulator
MSLQPTRPADEFTGRADQFWRARGGRMTVVREMICRSVTARESAFVAEELWQQVRRMDPGISMASIYRTLTDLVEAGLLREIRGPRDQRSFVKSDSPTTTSGHLICKDCHRIVPLDDGCLALREGPMIRGLGFDTSGMHLQIEAECESLKRCGTCENQANPS